MNNKFKILACFTRSYDKHHNSENLHLIASTVLVRENLDDKALIEHIKNSYSSRKFIIVDVLDDNDNLTISKEQNLNLEERKNKIFKYNENEYFGYIKISLNNLLKLYNSNENKESIDYVRNIFNYNSTEIKNKDQIYTQCLFIFNNITWSNIVWKFKINNINISGGGTHTRHILTSSDIILINYLNMLFDYNNDYIVDLGFNSYKNEKSLMSGQIPLNYYKNYLDRIKEIYNLSSDDIFNKIKLLTKSENSMDDQYIKIIANNLLISRDIIIHTMILNYKKNLIDNINSQLDKKKSEYQYYSNNYNVLESRNKHISNKEKKRLKEEKTNLIKKGLNSGIISAKLNKYNIEILDLETKLNLNKEELDNKIENLKNLSFGELFQQYEGIRQKFNSSGLNQNIFRKYKKPQNIRNYSTYFSRDKYYITQNCRNYSTPVSPSVKETQNENTSHDDVVLIKNNSLKYQIEDSKFLNGNATKNILFNNLKNIIKENNINNDTQKLIELEIYNYNMKLFKDKHNIWQDIANVNNELKELFINGKYELITQINLLKNKSLHSDYFNNLNICESFYNQNQKYKHSICISKILSEVDEEKIISVLLGKVLFIINNPKLENSYATKIFNELGIRIKQLFLYNLYVNERDKRSKLKIDQGNYFLKDWKEENKEFVKFFEDELFCIMLGSFCVDWLRDANLLELDTTAYIDNKSTSYFKITEAVSKKVLNKPIPLDYPDKLPMIVKPKKYKKDGDKERLGGYLLNGELYEDTIIIKNSRLRSNSIISDKNIIYDTINNMSSVGYIINKDVLNFIYLYNDKFNLTLINSKHPLENNVNKKKKLYKRELADLESFRSKRFVQENILAIADIFENVDEFFIPVRLDYRGRIYCSTNYLNYQGTELAKSLLMFSRGEKVLKTNKDAINYLKIFGANCFGNKLDKKSANDRIKWIDDNLDNIINFENGILIEKAEAKLLFIAFCFEYKKFIINKHNDHDYFITYLPIQLDATCNGYQHISMLGMDLDLNAKLNIKPSSWEEIPDDFYSLISALIKGYLKLKLDENNEKYNIYNRLYNLDMHRSIIKKCVMTIPYNTTALQGIKYLRENFEFDELETNIQNMNFQNIFDKDIDIVDDSDLDIIDAIHGHSDKKKVGDNKKQIWFKHKKNQELKLELGDFKELYFILKHVLYDVAPSLHSISEYLKAISKICIKGNTFIPWVLPTGLIIRQSYITLKELRISPFNYSKYSFVLKTKDMNKIDQKKNVRALMPNLIHSLDAASLSLLIDKYFNNFDNNIKNIFAIHDCFSTTSNNMKFVLESLKLIYISIYSDKIYLEELNENMVKHIKNRIDDSFDNDKIKYVTITKPDNKKIKLEFPDVNKILNKKYDISEYIKKSSYLIN